MRNIIYILTFIMVLLGGYILIENIYYLNNAMPIDCYPANVYSILIKQWSVFAFLLVGVTLGGKLFIYCYKGGKKTFKGYIKANVLLVIVALIVAVIMIISYLTAGAATIMVCSEWQPIIRLF